MRIGELVAVSFFLKILNLCFSILNQSLGRPGNLTIPTMRTSNPALSANTFRSVAHVGESRMTIQGTVNKTAFFLILTLVTASMVWIKFSANPASAMPWMMGGAIAGLVLCLITCFKKEWAAVTGSMYALAEGLFVGGISAYFNALYDGIVIQAAMLTFGTLFSLLFAYRSGWIKVTQNFRLGVVAATGGIFIMYLTSWIFTMFGYQSFLAGSSLLSIGISCVVVVIAALNLVLDFDFIETGAEVGAPKYMEWYAAFGLLVTLIWLYIEILRLLAKLANRK